VHQRLTALLIAGALAGVAYAQSPAPKMAEETYKNIVQLKGTPADQVGPAMQFIAASLGVNCEFCHVRARWTPTTRAPRRPRAK